MMSLRSSLAAIIPSGGYSRQALFFDVTAENDDHRCSTFLLPQCGHCTSPFSWSMRERILSKNFWQFLQKNS
jgi:hypothetical protein